MAASDLVLAMTEPAACLMESPPGVLLAAGPDRAPDAQPAAAEVLETEMDRRVDLTISTWPTFWPSRPRTGAGALSRSTWFPGRLPAALF